MKDAIIPGCLITATLILLMWAAFQLGEVHERKAAISAGVARWTVDEKTGEKHFEYITSANLR